MRRGLAAALLLAACSRGRVEAGSTVTLDYELTSGGKTVETTAGNSPITVVQGAGSLPAALDRALIGLRPKAELILELTPKESGFGPSDPLKFKAVPLSKFGELARGLKVGLMVDGVVQGKPASGLVTAIDLEEGVVTLDFNHPLAGKNLRYKVKVLSTRAP